MGTNKELLSKGIKYLGGLPLLFIGPSIIYNAFINKQNIWHYLVLAVGIATCLGAMYLLFFRTKYNYESFI
jgi:predicted tellurium resistance membrane protein TerC